MRKEPDRGEIMKTLACLIMLLMVSIYSAQGALANSDVQALVQDNSAFSLEIYQRLAESAGNIFFSPSSISTALAMTYGGARAATAKQMAQALHFTLPPERLHPAFAQLEAGWREVQQTGNVKLSMANSLWPQMDYTFLPDYLALIKRDYGVSITPLDYKRSPEAARGIINKWVEDRTQDKIKNLIPQGIINTLTRLVLVNAIYFKGLWDSQFEVKQTKNAPFFLSDEKSVQTPMMSQKQKFKYADLDSCQILELPYKGKELSMLLILPKEIAGLPQISKTLGIDNLNRWKSLMREQEILVILPKFRMTSMFRLDSTLQRLGMVDAFSEAKADFSGMDGKPQGLFIGAVIHKAFVDVGEEGTEAAAATAVVMETKSIARPPTTFRADHPFVFLIQENRTGSILFMGRVADPTTAGE